MALRRLIENGADVNVQGERFGNALQAATEWGNLVIGQLLLEDGVDDNIKGGEHERWIQRRCRMAQVTGRTPL
jgi:hypothetical protein